MICAKYTETAKLDAAVVVAVVVVIIILFYLFIYLQKEPRDGVTTNPDDHLSIYLSIYFYSLFVP